MKYYNVTFTFEIPVAVKDDEGDVDAYYEARDRFAEFQLNEAKVKMTEITESQFQTETKIVNKLHSKQ